MAGIQRVIKKNPGQTAAGHEQVIHFIHIGISQIRRQCTKERLFNDQIVLLLVHEEISMDQVLCRKSVATSAQSLKCFAADVDHINLIETRLPRIFRFPGASGTGNKDPDVLFR